MLKSKKDLEVVKKKLEKWECVNSDPYGDDYACSGHECEEELKRIEKDLDLLESIAEYPEIVIYCIAFKDGFNTARKGKKYTVGLSLEHLNEKMNQLKGLIGKKHE